MPRRLGVCAMCGINGGNGAEIAVDHFVLLGHVRGAATRSGRTTRSFGSIDLCERCRSDVGRGASATHARFAHHDATDSPR